MPQRERTEEQDRNAKRSEEIYDARIVEYVPRVRCDGCKHWCPHECPQCPVGHGFCEDGEQRAPDWYCAEHEAKEGT